jgi:hypothetical protein
MKPIAQTARQLLCAVTLTAFLQPSAYAALSSEELAKLAQNPVGNLISLPIQNNTNLNFGPEKGTQNVANIQPVIPVSVNKDWNIITRTILPVISMPSLYPGDSRTNGIGDTLFSAFLSPAEPGSFIWGAGTAIQIPTHNDSELGNRNWGAGPTFVGLHLEHGDPWVYGALISNVWSTSTSNQASFNNGTLQPFLNYNFPSGFYLTTSPIITANWKAEESDDIWTVPVGGGVGKIFHLGKLPLNTQIAAYYNVVSPDNGADWQIRFQIQAMFPKL